MPNSRSQCYDEIRKVMKDGLRRYYEEHEDRIGDARSNEAIEHSTRGLAAIFAVLDRYDIKKKTNGAK